MKRNEVIYVLFMYSYKREVFIKEWGIGLKFVCFKSKYK